jgi:hypothetical protein
MAKTGKKPSAAPDPQPEAEATSGWRERAELVLFLAVEVVCLLLFVDFLFFGIYVK